MAGQRDQRCEGDPEVADEKPDTGNDRDRYLHDLDPERHGTFGMAVGNLTGDSRQQDERDRETDTHDSLAAGSQLTLPCPIDHHERQHTLEDVVIHGPEKLRADQAKKAAFDEIAFHDEAAFQAFEQDGHRTRRAPRFPKRTHLSGKRLQI